MIPRLFFVLVAFMFLATASLAVEVRPTSTKTTTPETTDLHSVEASILEKTNAERKRFGLKPLTISQPLIDSARGHASWMCRTGNLVHTTKPVGENIAMGQRSATEALRSWMDSPGHRANILNPRYTQIGIAAYQAGEDRPIYWCQQFLP